MKRDYSNASMKLDVLQKDVQIMAAVAMRHGAHDTAAAHAVLERMKEDR